MMLWQLPLRPLRSVAKWLFRLTGQFDVATERLRHLRRRGVAIDFVIDAGAAFGEWSRVVRRVFPHSGLLCIEARSECLEALLRLKRGGVETQIEQVLLSNEAGHGNLYVAGEQSSMLPAIGGRPFGATVVVATKTLDQLYVTTGWQRCDLLKLDLQGAELTCLRGGEQLLRSTRFVLIESSLFAFYEGAPLITDVVRALSDAGFRLYDVWSLWRRPLDGALGFGDLLFAREGDPVFADPRWAQSAAWQSKQT